MLLSCPLHILQLLSSHVLLLSPQEENYEEEQDAGDEFDSDFDRVVRSLPSQLFLFLAFITGHRTFFHTLSLTQCPVPI